MTKGRLESYISMKEEIGELRDKLEHLAEETTGNSVINDYRSGFPVPQTVVGVDEHRYWRLYQKYNAQIKELERKCEEVEDYIDSISDSLTRRIFRAAFIDGQTQKTIGKVVHMDRSRISRRIDEYLSKQK